jgi:DNA (cytosine-5)-methyltransferase 1
MQDSTPSRTVLSLFTGAGGLDLGLEAAGFKNVLCVEIDKDARQTLRTNRPHWKLSEPGDIHKLTPAEILKQANLKPGELDLLAGGPPCQPFSKAGYGSLNGARRLDDPRAKTLKAYLDVVEATLPRALLLENVKGIKTKGKDEGLRFLLDGLELINQRQGTNYQPNLIELDAADYGVPQHRERLFLIASRDGQPFQTPAPTHGPGKAKPYVTALDAIGDLDADNWPEELNPRGKWAHLLPSIPEGQNYLWHTERGGGEPIFRWRAHFWSFLLKLAKDKPSWTIQASPGPAIGPFHWRGRLLSVEELCRLQTFPDGYKIFGSRRSAQRQLGNAVPVQLGKALGALIHESITNKENQ